MIKKLALLAHNNIEKKIYESYTQVKLNFKSDDEKLLIGYFFDSATFDGVGRNIAIH